LDLQLTLLLLLSLLIAIPVHEFAHALSAVNNGDDGPRRDGRLTIFPWDHFDPFGAFFCVLSSITGFGLGWGRPVLVNPNALRNPRWAMCRIAAWGPFSNFLLALGMALLFRFGALGAAANAGADADGLGMFFVVFLQVNLSLMLFNLIPLGPLDGAKVVVAFLPDALAHQFTRFQEQYGTILLFVLIFLGRDLLGMIIRPPLVFLYRLLVGL
jgi:Zn-dependent protease